MLSIRKLGMKKITTKNKTKKDIKNKQIILLFQ
jgi:hypothetical protein